MYDHDGNPFDGEESPDEYLDRLEALSEQAETHLERWRASMNRGLDEYSDTTLDLYKVAIEKAQESSQLNIDTLAIALKRRDPRPEEARSKWLYKKGMKGISFQ